MATETYILQKASATPQRWAMNKVGKGRRHDDLRELIESWSIPEPNSGCWLWLGAVYKSGYGSLNAEKFGIATGRANRISFMVHKGPIPEGFQACHTCDVRSCVNPDHLWLGTMKENNDDKIRKGRDARGSRQGTHTMPHTRLFGERAKHAKLTESQVLWLRSLPRYRGFNRSMAKELGVAPCTISSILNRKTWHYLPENPR